jgi:hypothetical protein
LLGLLVTFSRLFYQSCGVTKNYAKNIELSSLEGDEMNDLMEKVQADAEPEDAKCPINAKTKAFKKFLENFKEFWNRLGRAICKNTNLVKGLLECLLPISSSSLRTARRASTLAAYEIGSALVESVTELAGQLERANRQLSAEKKKAPKSKKAAQLEKSIATMDSESAAFGDVLETMFAGFVVTRWKDQDFVLRTHTVTFLGDLIYDLPSKFLQDKYLKYMGWLLTDPDGAVRLACVKSLHKMYEAESMVKAMELFTTRFLADIVKRTSDTTKAVQLAAMAVVETLCRRESVDFEDAQMAVIKTHVFDNDHEVSVAAALCVVTTFASMGDPSSDKTTKQKQDLQAQKQVKELLEFGENLVAADAPIECIDRGISAFWDLSDAGQPKVVGLRNWDVMLRMLRTDSSNKKPLSERQQVLLARIIHACGYKAAHTEVPGKRGKANNELKIAARDLTRDMTTQLLKHLPDLLGKFKAANDVMFSLLSTISLFDLDVATEHRHKAQFCKLLDMMKDAFTTHLCPKVLGVIAKTVGKFADEEQSDCHSAIEDMADNVIEQLKSAVSKKQSKKRDSDGEYSLGLWLRRCHILLKRANADTASKMSKMIKPLCALVEERSNPADIDVCMLDPMVMVEAQEVLAVHLTSLTERVFTIQDREPKRSEVEALVTQRDAVIHALQSALRDDEAEDDKLTAEESAYERAVKRYACSKLSDFRMLFNKKLELTLSLPQLAWDVDQELSKRMFKVVEEVIEELQSSDGDADEDDDDNEMQQAKHAELAEVLRGLAGPNVYAELNRREAAAVASKFLHTAPEVQSIVRYFNQQLKLHQGPRYLEVQMSVLRGTFRTYLCNVPQDEEETDDLFFYNQMTALARRFAATLGVAGRKVTDATLRPSFEQFLREGIRYSLENESQLVFLDAMKPYMGKSHQADLKKLQKMFDDKVANFAEELKAPMEIEHAKENHYDRSLEWGAFFEFHELFADAGMATPAAISPIRAIRT